MKKDKAHAMIEHNSKDNKVHRSTAWKINGHFLSTVRDSGFSFRPGQKPHAVS